jgi:hypothetical protein
METELNVIKVKAYSGTYIARFRGKTASCTAGEYQAAEAVARKVMGNKPFELRPRQNDFNWDLVEIIPMTNMERSIDVTSANKHEAAVLYCQCGSEDFFRWYEATGLYVEDITVTDGHVNVVECNTDSIRRGQRGQTITCRKCGTQLPHPGTPNLSSTGRRSA